MEDKVIRIKSSPRRIIKEVRHRSTWSDEDLGVNTSIRRRYAVKECVNNILDTLPVDDNIQITISPIESKYGIKFVDVTAHYFEEVEGD